MQQDPVGKLTCVRQMKQSVDSSIKKLAAPSRGYRDRLYLLGLDELVQFLNMSTIP